MSEKNILLLVAMIILASVVILGFIIMGFWGFILAFGAYPMAENILSRIGEDKDE